MLFFSIITAVAILGGSGLLPLSAALDGGFKDNCNLYSAQLIGQDLGMYCNNDNTAMFGYNWTWISLDNCIENSGGRLCMAKNGHFSGSCHNCSIKRDGPEPTPTLNLTCDCQKLDRTLSPSSLDLNNLVHNDDGRMGCFDIWGNKSLRGPLPKLSPFPTLRPQEFVS